MSNAALWTPPFPRIGGKRRDAICVAALLDAWKPATIVVPLAGLAGELSAWTGDANLVVADADPALYVIWRVARSGRTASCAQHARWLWNTALHDHADWPLDMTLSAIARKHGQGRVARAWRSIRDREHEHVLGLWPSPNCDESHAAHAILLGAGAQRGGWRRGTTGEFDRPYAPDYDPEFASGRIIGDEAAQAADAWALRRTIVVRDDWRKCFASDIARGVTAYLIDPPQVYDGSWNSAQRDALIEETRTALAVPSRYAVVWCGVDDIDAWRTALPRLVWGRREAATCVKAARVRDDGRPEAARKSADGWIGLSRLT